MPQSNTAPPPVVVITGASSGIGYELAKLFARDGYQLVLIASNAARLAEAARTLQQTTAMPILTLVQDLSRPNAPEDIVTAIHQQQLKPTVLVNNAGVGVAGSFTHTDLALELAMIHVNVVALTHLTKLFLPDVIKSGQGKILNVASTGAFVPGPLMPVYFATKAYVLSFSQALAHDLRATGVSVTTLCPGPTRTDFYRRAGTGPPRLARGHMMTAQAVALAGYRGLMRRKTVVIPGWRHRLGVLALRALPQDAATRLMRALQQHREPCLSGQGTPSPHGE